MSKALLHPKKSEHLAQNEQQHTDEFILCIVYKLTIFFEGNVSGKCHHMFKM